MNNSAPVRLPAHERIILLIERYPWSAIYRIGLGYVIPLLYYRVYSKEDSEFFLAPWFFSCLLALRILPAILRKFLLFSSNVKAIWIERREIAKRYDSYQWRKLIWFGIGMACYATFSGSWGGIVGALTLFCIIGGGIGILVWRKRSAVGGVALEETHVVD